MSRKILFLLPLLFLLVSHALQNSKFKFLKFIFIVIATPDDKNIPIYKFLTIGKILALLSKFN